MGGTERQCTMPCILGCLYTQEEEGPVGAVGNPESSEGFPNGCWNRGVFGAISKGLWESCGKVRVFESAFHNSSIAPSPVSASTGGMA